MWLTDFSSATSTRNVSVLLALNTGEDYVNNKQTNKCIKRTYLIWESPWYEILAGVCSDSWPEVAAEGKRKRGGREGGEIKKEGREGGGGRGREGKRGEAQGEKLTPEQ